MKRHVEKASTKNGKKQTNILITEANSEVLNYWHKNIQLPFINTMDNKRLDKGWNWPIIIYRLHGILAKARNQEPVCYSIGKQVNGAFIPLGLVFLAERYPALFNKQKKSSYIWYLSVAPKEFMDRFIKKDDMPKLGELCVDIGITTSFNNGNDGIIGLHASPEGGDWLFDFYDERCGLINLNKGIKLPYLRKLQGNDGRYFFADEAKAKFIHASNDEYR